MATVNKDFKIKSGLIVEGTTGTINGQNILTTSEASTQHIIDIVGGETLITSVNTNQLDVADGLLSVNAEVFDDFGSAAAAQSAAETFATNADTTLYGTVTTDIATAKSEAGVIAQGYADTAESDANAYTDQRETAANSYADTKKTEAISAAATYTDTALEDYTPTNGLDSAVGGYGYIKQADIDLNDYATESYVTTAVENLVDGAPGLLDTLNELAAAINDDANYATTLTSALAGKQDNLTAGSNIDISANTISVTGLDSEDISDFSTAAQSANAGLWDTSGAASTAETNANSYTDGEISDALTTAQGYATTAYNDAVAYADALTTDDVAETSGHEYFTTTRAQMAAADLLLNATKTNIDITGSYMGLTITAENGVADSNTDDLAEGEDNLYFTDERAIDAVSGADIYPNAVILNNVSKQIATQITAATAGIQVGSYFAKADYRSAEFLVKVAYGTHTEVSKVLLTLDTSDNIAITEYGIVGTNGSASTISADISGTDVRLLVTTVNNDSTITVVGTLLI
jgi:hypothetical protein